MAEDIYIKKFKDFDMKFGIFGSFWERWAEGNFPEQGGISDDLKKWIKDNFIPKNE